jgi:hypothetical protein
MLFVETTQDKRTWLNLIVERCRIYTGTEFVIVILSDDDFILVEEALRKKGLATRVFN